MFRLSQRCARESLVLNHDLIAECQRRGLEETGTLAVLRSRLKEARQGSVEDIFKNYELKQSKDESSREDYTDG
jgi:DNA polymerase delta subunit 1